MHWGIVILAFAVGFSAAFGVTFESEPAGPSESQRSEAVGEAGATPRSGSAPRRDECEPVQPDHAEVTSATEAQTRAAASPVPQTFLPPKYHFMVEPEVYDFREFAERAAAVMRSPAHEPWVADLESQLPALIDRYGVADVVSSEFVRCGTLGCVIAGYASPSSDFDGCVILAWGFQDRIWPVRSAGSTCNKHDQAGLRRFVSIIEFDNSSR